MQADAEKAAERYQSRIRAQNAQLKKETRECEVVLSARRALISKHDHVARTYGLTYWDDCDLDGMLRKDFISTMRRSSPSRLALSSLGSCWTCVCVQCSFKIDRIAYDIRLLSGHDLQQEPSYRLLFFTKYFRTSRILSVVVRVEIFFVLYFSFWHFLTMFMRLFILTS